MLLAYVTDTNEFFGPFYSLPGMLDSIDVRDQRLENVTILTDIIPQKFIRETAIPAQLKGEPWNLGEAFAS